MRWIAGLLIFFAVSTACMAQERVCPGILLMTEPDGSSRYGSTGALIAAVEQGQSIRVGWHFDWQGDGEIDIIHWVNADFISIYRGEVFAQFQGVHANRPQGDAARMELTPDFGLWHGMVGTDSVLKGRLEGGEITEYPVRVLWCPA